jgi:excisionase family DNA binding protein
MATNHDNQTGFSISHPAQIGIAENVAKTTALTGRNPLLKRRGLAETLNCSLRTIDNLQASGMPCVFIGRSRRFIADEVIAWLKRKGSR